MNGAGKSTLIKMLCGLVKPTSGEGFILGYNLTKETTQVKKSLLYLLKKPQLPLI